MNIINNFVPILLFMILYVVSGVYYSLQGVQNAFYQISPILAIMPAIMLSWVLQKRSGKEKIASFLEGARHEHIITMCFIFLLSGAFGSITKSIGSVDSAVDFALMLFPAKYLFVGIFITSSFIAMAIGSSMGTIATVAPIIIQIANKCSLNIELSIATVVGGAMFGDNLSLISDTTIAAVMSQNTDARKKLRFNSVISIISGIITISILLLKGTGISSTIYNSSSLLLISPYIVLVFLAIFGVDVLIALSMSCIYAGVLGTILKNYSIIRFNCDILSGFSGMYEIMVLSILVGGLSSLSQSNSKSFTNSIYALIPSNSGKKVAQLLIAKVVSVFDILTANNVIAIIFSGNIAKDIAKKYGVPSHKTAAWLDIFSCVFQGIIPHGAQILLASSIAKVSPLSIIGQVYYCYILGVVAIMYILIKK